MFTDRTKKDIKQLFKRVRAADYAKMEDIAPRTFTIPKGPLDPSKYPVSMDPFLRKLGLTTKIEKGVVELTQDYVACRIGEPITADGARILKLWEQKLSEFHIGLVAHWQKSTEVAKHIKSEEAEAATTTMAAEED
jgi:mRNA turnover protein 4